MTSVITCRDLTPLFEGEPITMSRDGYLGFYAWTDQYGQPLVWSNTKHYTEWLYDRLWDWLLQEDLNE